MVIFFIFIEIFLVVSIDKEKIFDVIFCGVFKKVVLLGDIKFIFIIFDFEIIDLSKI